MSNGAVAKRYARAVFEIAQEHQATDQWLDDLRRIQSILNQPEMAAFLGDSRPSRESKKNVVSLAGKGLGPLSLNLMSLLVAKGRIQIIDDLIAEYQKMLNEHRGVAVVRVTTAVPLDERERSRVTERLAALIGRKVLLETSVDPAIMGGIVARIGDQLIDGSTRAKLLSMKLKLAGPS